MNVTPRTTCRACDAPLCEPWFTNEQPVYWTKATADQHVDVLPLSIANCSECGLVQSTNELRHDVQTGELYEPQTSPSWQKHHIVAKREVEAALGEGVKAHIYQPSWGDAVAFVSSTVGDTSDVAVCELPYAGALLTGRLDLLRHTQATYWTVTAWHQAMKRAGYIVLNVQKVDRDGGMIRTYNGRPEWYRHAPGCESWRWWEELADLQFDGFDIAVRRYEAHKRLVQAKVTKAVHWCGVGNAAALARQAHVYGVGFGYIADPELRERATTWNGVSVPPKDDARVFAGSDRQHVALDPNDPKAAMDALLEAKWTGTATILAPGIRTVQVNGAA